MEYMRKCTHCREMKPITEFSAVPTWVIQSGFQVKCRKCEEDSKRLFDEHTREKR